MTPSQLDRLRAIDAHLERLLEIAAKRTPGRWIDSSESVWAKDEEDEKICGESGGWDVDFIAACAGNAEAGWESTRILIAEFLSMQDRMAKMGAPEFTCGPLEKLLAQWPLELLATAKV